MLGMPLETAQLILQGVLTHIQAIAMVLATVKIKSRFKRPLQQESMGEEVLSNSESSIQPIDWTTT